MRDFAATLKEGERLLDFHRRARWKIDKPSGRRNDCAVDPEGPKPHGFILTRDKVIRSYVSL